MATSSALQEAVALLQGNVSRTGALRAIALLAPHRPPADRTAFTSDEYRVLIQCGRAEILAGRYEDAVNTFTQYLRVAPKNDGVLASRGVAHQLLGHSDSALADFNAALHIDPTDDLCRKKRDQLLRELGLDHAALHNATDGLLLCTDATKLAAARELAADAHAALKRTLSSISAEAVGGAVRSAADAAETHAVKRQKVVDTRFDRLTARVNELHDAQRAQLTAQRQALEALQRDFKHHTATAASAVAAMEAKVDALPLRVAKHSASAAAAVANGSGAAPVSATATAAAVAALADPGPVLRGNRMSAWTVAEVGEWLHAIGSAYGSYAHEFGANGLNGAAVLELSDELLSELGVANRLHRARLMGDIKRARAAVAAAHSILAAAAAVSSAAAAAGAGAGAGAGPEAPASAAASSSSSASASSALASRDAVVNEVLAEQQRQRVAAEAATDAHDRLRQCTVCLSADRNVRFSPCGHMCCCSECGGKALTRCPLCQKAIKSRQTTYFS